jgi:S-adenosylmethionine hydrolase
VIALITLTTDFGLVDPWVGIMKGVLATRAPETRVIDVTHGIPPQNVLAGALVLRSAVPFFPPATIHLAVVDPGVGSERRPICVETAREILVGPDNGLLSLAAAGAPPVRAYHLKEGRFFPSPRSSTFHGRDVFAPVAAALATGTRPAELGPEIRDMRILQVPEPRREVGAIRGQVIYVDHFGNLITNVPQSLLANFPAEASSISIRGIRVAVAGISPSYAAVSPGQPVAVVNSWNHLEIAVRDGSAAAVLGAGVGDEVVVT